MLEKYLKIRNIFPVCFFSTQRVTHLLRKGTGRGIWCHLVMMLQIVTGGNSPLCQVGLTRVTNRLTGLYPDLIPIDK